MGVWGVVKVLYGDVVLRRGCADLLERLAKAFKALLKWGSLAMWVKAQEDNFVAEFICEF